MTLDGTRSGLYGNKSNSNSSSGSRESSTGKRSRSSPDHPSSRSLKKFSNSSVEAEGVGFVQGHDMNRSVARPPSVSGVEQAMTPGLIGSLVEELKSGSGTYTLQEFYTIFRDSLAAAKKGNVDQVPGELRVSIEPLRRPVQEFVSRFGAFPAAHQIELIA